MTNGLLSHIDFSVGNPEESILFYDVLLTGLGYTRWRASSEEWQEPNPTRAAWGVSNLDGTTFGIDLRPAERGDRRYDRYEPGPHHIAFNVDEDKDVDAVFESMCELGAEVLDEPTNYGGQPAYGDHYYAVFFADPDGFKIEIVHSRGFEV